MIKRTSTEIVLLSISGLTTLIIFPFAVIRWHSNDTTIAIIDAVISLTLAIFFVFVFKTRRVDVAKYLLAIFLAVAATASIVVKGQTQIYWLYPVFIGIYYLIPPKVATGLCLIIITTVLFVTPIQSDIINTLTIIFTTTLTSVLAFIIFRSHEKKLVDSEKLATIDPLTSTGNRRALDFKLSELVASQHRGAYPMCLILIDLDDFKHINDDYGHSIGDKILVTTCNLIRDHTRILDSLYRYGGDEFIIMPLNMDLNSAKRLAENIRSIIERYKFISDIKLTLSIGVAEHKPDDTPEGWIRRADTLLYKAKNNGRNKVF
ncbi:GGDEF domain-containing protein [Colwellia hornerae]|uniref:diguanylate cyclase n=1 Tax=Colwellia hornerae TaxID=89402 RepID=A0A5C6QFR3_9GAMM|nr:GGDEF domain-containing protein [Colwellia hornerae]TWX52312.1 GGDEF domain-containing protein [Colwellia hornerae]TWX57871.1 GGDEF domain-containing protein [Colwellia hornerae]TWX67573.1 GGDEF domain-containing protein [Colwellia hornerae]